MAESRKSLILLIPGARLELAQCFHRWILSPLRLPIPPSRHKEGKQVAFLSEGNATCQYDLMSALCLNSLNILRCT